VIVIAPVAQSLGCRVLGDGLMYVFFLLALAAFVAACLFAFVLRSFSDRRPGRRKQTEFSKSE
jgi:phosphotransferase system  glucose/maltose/N-acetylglucosamine-specific IIC component